MEQFMSHLGRRTHIDQATGQAPKTSTILSLRKRMELIPVSTSLLEALSASRCSDTSNEGKDTGLGAEGSSSHGPARARTQLVEMV